MCSHPPGDVGENHHCWLCWEDLQCNWMEGWLVFLFFQSSRCAYFSSHLGPVTRLPPTQGIQPSRIFLLFLPSLPCLSFPPSPVFPSLPSPPSLHQTGWSVGPEHLIKHLQTVNANTGYTMITPIQVSETYSLVYVEGKRAYHLPCQAATTCSQSASTGQAVCIQGSHCLCSESAVVDSVLASYPARSRMPLMRTPFRPKMSSESTV